MADVWYHFSFHPCERFYHREMKFKVKFLYRDIHKKTTKVRQIKLLDRNVTHRFKMTAILDLHVVV